MFVITEYNESEVDEIFYEAVNESFNNFPENLWNSPADIFIQRCDNEEDETRSILWMEDGNDCVIDQLEEYEINAILLIMEWE